jgi:hypothetical protein
MVFLERPALVLEPLLLLLAHGALVAHVPALPVAGLLEVLTAFGLSVEQALMPILL